MTLRTHYSSQISEKDDNKKVVVAGWIQKLRDLGKIKFIVLRDRDGEIQITIKDSEELAKIYARLVRESVISVAGIVKKNSSAPGGREIFPDKIIVLSQAESPLPLETDAHIQSSLDKRLDFRPIDLRLPRNRAIFKVQSTLIQEMQAFLKSRDFMQIFTPCIMGVTSEGGAEVFPVVYFDKEAFLRQDPQLHRQLSIAGGLEKVYDIGPAWRAEQSHTTKHMCEHRVMAVETSFIENEYDVMELQESLVSYAMEKLKKDCPAELEMFNATIEIPRKFPVLEFPKIYDILKELGEKLPRGEDLTTAAEKNLGEYVKEKYKSDFFFVNRFPFAVKPFYVMRVDDEPEWARSTDLIFRGIEMSSGGQREHRYNKIIEQAKIKKMKLESINWFADFFRYGVPPHGGFALGIERLTMQILGLENVREATLFPRDTERLVP
ncbi:MAG: aspartate--tRNA(Asn) ligase [Candidatus Aenigmarchaeota archaeon]|nr:aspartate--tRNA(Asn) ligase [Candidatus Aenigmarchaeota archaeon]